jgi:hypothetical protein
MHGASSGTAAANAPETGSGPARAAAEAPRDAWGSPGFSIFLDLSPETKRPVLEEPGGPSPDDSGSPIDAEEPAEGNVLFAQSRPKEAPIISNSQKWPYGDSWTPRQPKIFARKDTKDTYASRGAGLPAGSKCLMTKD